MISWIIVSDDAFTFNFSGSTMYIRTINFLLTTNLDIIIIQMIWNHFLCSLHAWMFAPAQQITHISVIWTSGIIWNHSSSTRVQIEEWRCHFSHYPCLLYLAGNLFLSLGLNFNSMGSEFLAGRGASLCSFGEFSYRKIGDEWSTHDACHAAARTTVLSWWYFNRWQNRWKEHSMQIEFPFNTLNLIWLRHIDFRSRGSKKKRDPRITIRFRRDNRNLLFYCLSTS